jgi:hypothetical protein
MRLANKVAILTEAGTGIALTQPRDPFECASTSIRRMSIPTGSCLPTHNPICAAFLPACVPVQSLHLLPGGGLGSGLLV